MIEDTLETPAEVSIPEEKVEPEESKEEVASYAEEVEAAIVVNAEVDVEKSEEVSEETSEDTVATSVAEAAKEVTEEVTETATEKVTEEVPKEVTEEKTEEKTEEVTEEKDEEPAAEQKSSIPISHSESTEQQRIETQPPLTGTDIICSLEKTFEYCHQYFLSPTSMLSIFLSKIKKNLSMKQSLI